MYIYVVVNVEQMYSAKSLNTAYLTWQIFSQKSRHFSFYCNISLGVWFKLLLFKERGRERAREEISVTV